MQETSTGSRRQWFRGLLFCALASPLLGALFFTVAFSFRDGVLHPIPLLLPYAVILALMFATWPALLSGVFCTSLALHWRRRGAPRSSIQLRLALLGIPLGIASAAATFSLWQQELVVDLRFLPLGAVVGSLVGLLLPRAVWGPLAA
jgi:hypothetical protein